MAAGFAGLLAGWMCRTTSFWRHSIGLILCTSCLALVFVQSLHTMWNSRQAVRRVMCVNNLKQIGLALANYEDVYGAYPPRVSRDRQGRPLLSWWVALLPYLEQDELYAKFHLDEPWDGPHNRALIDQIPRIYACPGQAAWSRKQTLYQVLDGPGTFLDPAKPTRRDEISDGPDKTLAVVETFSPVAWTGPGDIDSRRDRPFPGRETTHPGGFNASLVDGSVRFLKNTIAARIWDALGTRAGGEVINPDAY